MTNKEFYGDKLLTIMLTSVCRRLYRTVYGESCATRAKCEDCEFCTVESVESWLNKEHVEAEPPLLKNGDGLKPGDWIMVKEPDDEVWVKKIFAYYYGGCFFCAHDIAFFKNGLLANRTKARLPEDGE